MLLTPFDADAIVLRQHESGLIQLHIQARAGGCISAVNQSWEKGLDFAHGRSHILLRDVKQVEGHMGLPDHLLDGYARFRTGRYAQDEARYRSLGAGLQRPKLMIIACCDSRAAPETIFDAGPGEIFVMRNVANLVPPYAPDGGHHATSAAIEFAVLQLGVKDIVVMGHGRCGGIRAVVEGGDPLSAGDFIGKWMSDVHDVAAAVKHDHDHTSDFQTAVEHASVEHSLANLRTFPWLRMRENKAEVGLHGAWFDIALGELHAYDAAGKSWGVV